MELVEEFEREYRREEEEEVRWQKVEENRKVFSCYKMADELDNPWRRIILFLFSFFIIM